MIKTALLFGFLGIGVFAHRKRALLIVAATIVITWGWLAATGWRQICVR